MLKISAFLFNTSVDSHESPTTFSCSNIILHRWWSYLIWFMNENLLMFSHCLKFHRKIHDTTAFMHQQVLAKRISWVSGLSLVFVWAVVSATGLSVLWSTFSTFIFHCFYVTCVLWNKMNEWMNYSLRYERNCEWVFFLNTVYIAHLLSSPHSLSIHS